MAEYIEKDAFIRSIEGNPFTTESVKSYIRVSVKKFPAANVAEVVRCNQCKHYDGVHNVQGCAPFLFWNAMVLWNWFCFNGERKDGAE